jgi:hypothetical protein
VATDLAQDLTKPLEFTAISMSTINKGKHQGSPPRKSVIVHGIFTFFILLILVFAGLSLFQGFFNALKHSQDFQWSPASLLLRRLNPYQAYLNGNQNNEIILSQVPNYAQLLYVILSPLGAMSFASAKIVWAFINIGLALLAPLASAKLFRLNQRQTLVTTVIFILSTPTRNTIGNGQHSLLILVSFLCALLISELSIKSPVFIRRSPTGTRLLLSSCMAGISYVKYSFAPTLGVSYLRRYGYRYFLLSFIPMFLGIVLFALWANDGLVTIDFLFQPVRVASRAVSSGAGDLLSVLKLHLPQEGVALKVASLACVVLAGSAPFWVLPGSEDLKWWSFCSVASLSFVTHLGYDYVFYLLPAIFAIKNIRSQLGVSMAALVAYPWFIAKILTGIGVGSNALTHIGLVVNFIVLYLLWASMRETPGLVKA